MTLAKNYLSKYGILIALLVICVILSIATPYFFTVQNLVIVLRQVSVNGILAIGVTFVIIVGGIDLSLGSVVALTGVAAASVAAINARPKRRTKLKEVGIQPRGESSMTTTSSDVSATR